MIYDGPLQIDGPISESPAARRLPRALNGPNQGGVGPGGQPTTKAPLPQGKNQGRKQTPGRSSSAQDTSAASGDTCEDGWYGKSQRSKEEPAHKGENPEDEAPRI